ncbi:hypothetical protein DFH07DRAFT_1065589 [Mycena maculata]|uniref:Uncharacterized protein n=1 Tax=Mycena maculata TaxID=230809 RepID=A0AAD7I194_9AGAR|nr:hypothetical protein DFH07DRAFT_1065589 [Mycena maculata]
MTSEKPRIAFPSPTVDMEAPCNATRTRIGHLAAELLLTVCVSFAILLGLLRALGIADNQSGPPYIVAYRPSKPSIPPALHYRTCLPAAEPNFPDASTLGILRVTIVCTVLVYAAVDGGAALWRRMRRRTISDADQALARDGAGSYGACRYDGMGALEAGWAPVLAIADGKANPRDKAFAMAPGGSGRARTGLGLCASVRYRTIEQKVNHPTVLVHYTATPITLRLPPHRDFPRNCFPIATSFVPAPIASHGT